MPPSAFLQRLLSTLKAHYSAPMAQSFKQFKLGAMMFFTGMVGLYIAQTALADSWQQEFLALGGLLLGGAGFVLAMMAQIRMLVSRILSFYSDKPGP